MNYSNFSKNVLSWYNLNKRDLPWRYKGNSKKDPYKVWVSEIMLQQTTVTAVIPYYNKFIKRWPNIKKLSSTNIEDVLDFWSGLGYYRRARNLHLTAGIINNEFNGVFPNKESEIKNLPGIGEYTSAAIRAIAFNKNDTVVDSNIERIMARVFYLKDPINKIKKKIKEYAKMLTPNRKNGDYIQALMDIGSMICLPKNPHCESCPIIKFCLAKKSSSENIIPIKIKKKIKPIRKGSVYLIISSDNKVLLKRREDNGILPGMLEFPSYGWSKDGSEEIDKKILSIDDFKRKKGSVSHQFSHFNLLLTVYEKKEFNVNDINGMWIDKKDLGNLGLPTLMKKVFNHVNI
jgi:A/G-specific adenine glycosylase